MPTRYIGRLPTQKGKPLYEICQQLANSGVGRVVYRHKFAEVWPTQKSFYRLTKVIPDKTCTEFRHGTAWGQKIFRGIDLGEAEISSGVKSDWILVPKHEEKEFCKITEVMDVPPEPPSHIACPPWLQLLLQKQHQSDKKVEIPFVAKQTRTQLQR